MTLRERVTFVSLDPVAHGVGASQVLPVVNLLASRGWNMALVSCERDPSDHDAVRGRLDDRVTFESVPFGSEGAMPGLVRIARISRRIPKSEILHVRSDQAFMASLPWMRRSRVIWDVRSFWAEQKREIGSTSTMSPYFHIMNQVEHLATRKADGILTLSQAGAQAMLTKWGSIPIHRRVVPTLVDTQRFEIAPMPPIDVIHALYSGTYNGFYDLGLSREFLRIMGRHHPIDVAWASEYPLERERLDHAGASEVMASDYVRLPDVLRTSHFGLAICRLDAGRSLAMAVPTKIAEFLATGRPVVVSRGVGDMDDLIARYRVGVTIESADEAHLGERAETLLDLLSDPDLPNRCRALAENWFSLEVGVQQISDLYEEVRQIK